MKNICFIFTLIGFSILSFGCESKNRNGEIIDSSTFTNTSSTKEDQIELSKKYLLGKWTSTEVDWPINLEISNNLSTDSLELTILNSEQQQEQALFDSKNTENNYWTFFTEDHSKEYRLSIYENQLLMILSYVQEENADTPNVIRPWILKKSNNE